MDFYESLSEKAAVIGCRHYCRLSVPRFKLLQRRNRELHAMIIELLPLLGRGGYAIITGGTVSYRSNGGGRGARNCLQTLGLFPRFRVAVGTIHCEIGSIRSRRDGDDERLISLCT